MSRKVKSTASTTERMVTAKKKHWVVFFSFLTIAVTEFLNMCILQPL